MNMGVKCDHTESIHACLMTWCRWQVEIRPAITAVSGKKLSFYYKTYDEEWTLMWQTIKRRGWSNCTRRTVIKQKEQNTCVMHHHHFELKTENACILSIHLHDNLKHIVKTAVKNASDHRCGCLYKLCNSAFQSSCFTFIYIPLYTTDGLKASSFTAVNMKNSVCFHPMLRI